MTKVVDECPGCGINHLDLFPDAFAALADPNKGIIDVTWNYVDCAITAPLQLHLKDGVSAYWFSIQVVNAKKAVKSVDVSTDGGSTWKPTTRMDYNFFENPSGFGTKTVTVKVTSVDGDEVIVKNVGVSSGISITTTDNFGISSAASISSPAASKSTSSEVKQVSMVNKVAKTFTQVLEATSISASSTASISGANFIEIKPEPTTLATVAAPILSSTYSAVPTTSAAPITSTEPSTLSESSYILSISKASTTSAAFTQTPSVGTTSAYTVPSSLVSGSVPSSTAVPNFIPVSSASQIVAGFGCLVGVCMALLF